jgi:hypothetical protein
MEGIPPEIQNPPEKHGSLPLLVVTMLVAVYFLFPPIFTYPVFLFYGGTARFPWPVLNTMRVFYYPVDKLGQAVPAYEKFMEWEARLLGMHM